MGTASIVLAIIGICFAWVPGFGWGAVVLGVLGLGASVPSITHWHPKPGYTGWGISGLFLGVWSTTLGLAYQTKYIGAPLQQWVLPLSVTQVILAWVGAGLLTALGLYITRVKRANIGLAVAAVSLVAVTVCSASGLLTADAAYTGSHPPGVSLSSTQ